MFPLIGILVAAALLFSKRKKTPSVVAVAPVKALTATKVPARPTTKPTVKPAATTSKVPAKATIKQPTSPIQGLPLPTASLYTADVLGSMLGTNPKVLAPTLPYGYYDPGTNTAGQTPPIMAPTYR